MSLFLNANSNDASSFSGLFYEKHLKQIHLNEVYTSFTKMNLTYLIKVGE